MSKAEGGQRAPASVWLVTICGLLLWLNTQFVLAGYPNHDFSVFLALAVEAVERGRRYYVDLYEFNPPTFLYLAEAIVRIAKLTGVSLSAASAGFFSALTALCLFALWLPVRRLAGLSDVAKAGIVVLVCVMLTIGSGTSHSQRDVVAFAAMLPALFWWIAGGAPRGQGILPGLLLGFAVTIRPTIALLPLFLSAADAWRSRSPRPLFTSLNLAAAAVTIVYTVLLATVWRAYFDNILPLLQALKATPVPGGGMDMATLQRLLITAPACCAMLGAALIDKRASGQPFGLRRWLAGLGVMMGIVFANMLFFGVSDYRAMPVAGAFALCFYLSALVIGPRIPRMTRIAVYGLIGLVLLINFPTVFSHTGPRISPLDTLMGKAGPVAYSPLTNMVVAQGIIDHPLRLAGFANSLGMVYELSLRAATDPAMPAETKALHARIEKDYLDRMTAVLERDRPEFLLVEFSVAPSPAPLWWPKDRVFSYAGWLCQDARFRRIWPLYEPLLDLDALTIYKRRDHAIDAGMQAEVERLRAAARPLRFAHIVDCENGPRP